MKTEAVKITYWIVVFITMILILLSCNTGTFRDQERIRLYQQVVPVVVTVRGDAIHDYENKVRGMGTGFFVNKEYVLTNYHIASILAQGTVELQLWNGDIISAKKVAIDKFYDLALLQVDPNDTKFYDIPELSFETYPQVGETVFIIGSPRLYNNTMVMGILSRGLTTGLDHDYNWLWDCRIYFVDATIADGNSGSPVLDVNHNVIGIVSGYGSNLTIVIPSHSILSFLRAHGI